MKIDILTLFPKMFSGPFDESLVGRARSRGLADINIYNLRDFSSDAHHKVDDKPFGGGPGMVLAVEPIFSALRFLSVVDRTGKKISGRNKNPFVIVLSPQGKKLDQKMSLKLAKKKHLLLICGHYKGMDERVMRWADEEISIGDYVLTGGELPAMVLVDSVVRLLPGVVRSPASIVQDSFFQPRLDHAHYTRPSEFMEMKVPQVLLSGNHQEIKKWKEQDALRNTLKKRPDLLSR